MRDLGTQERDRREAFPSNDCVGSDSEMARQMRPALPDPGYRRDRLRSPNC